MAANTNPIYSRAPNMGWAVLTTANTAKDGTGTIATIFTADATNGGRVEKVIAEAQGTNTASVLRLFINNGATNATPANNSLIRQIALPGTTVTEVDGQIQVIATLDLVLPPGYKINAVIGTTVAAGWAVTASGGDY